MPVQKKLFFFLFFILSISVNAQIMFDEYVTLNIGSGPQTVDIAIEDMNNDGRDDLIVLNSNNGIYQNSIELYYQTEDDSLTSIPIVIPFGIGVSSSSVLRIIDVDNNGLLDIAIRGYLNVMVLYQDSVGEYSVHAIPIEENIFGGGYDLGDLNGDNLVDIAYAGFNQKFIGVLYQQVDSSFIEVHYPTTINANFKRLDIVDLDDDGLNDLLYGNTTFNNDTVYYQMQADTGLMTNYNFINIEHDFYEYGDINNDGLIDIFTEEGNVVAGIKVWLQQSDSISFVEQYEIPLAWDSDELALGDVNCDGFVDLVASYGGSGHYYVFRGSAFGFSSYIEYNVPYNSRQLALGDMNSDGKLDIHIQTRYMQNSSLPELTDYSIVDTFTTITFTTDTIITPINTLYENQWSTPEGCQVNYSENSIITTTTIQEVTQTDNIFLLEADFCDSIYYDSIPLTTLQSSISILEVDSMFLDSSFDTLVSAPSPSDYIIVNSSEFVHTTYDTSTQQNIEVIITAENLNGCSTELTDSLLITMMTINQTTEIDSVFYLEANLCNTVFYDNFFNTTTIYAVIETIDTILISSILDTISTSTLIGSNEVVDTILQSLFFQDSLIVVNENQEQIGDSLFTTVDSFWVYQVFGEYEIQSNLYSYFELNSCGLISYDTTSSLSIIDTMIFIEEESSLISQTISVEIIDGILNQNIEPLNFYPNPTDGIFAIKIPNQLREEKIAVVISNLIGQVVYKKILNVSSAELNLNLKQLPKSSYLVSIKSTDKNYLGTIVIQ